MLTRSQPVQCISSKWRMQRVPQMLKLEFLVTILAAWEQLDGYDPSHNLDSNPDWRAADLAV